MTKMVMYFAENVTKHAKVVITREALEIINVSNAKKVMNRVKECIKYVIKFVKMDNFFILKIHEKKNVVMYVQMKSRTF